MGFPKPLGKYAVGFGDFELRRIDVKETPNSAFAPPFRVFYPTNAKVKRSWRNRGTRAWLPDLRYTWGFCCSMVRPKNSLRRAVIWIMASVVHVALRPFSSIQASAGSTLLPPSAEDEETRLPVVIFSHGLWCCRTTFSAFCCDLASHGYVVAAIEHLDGTAQMARYVDRDGKTNWLPYAHPMKYATEISLDERAPQLNLRVKEVRQVIDVLESLDHGLLTQGSNTSTGKTKLEVTSLLHRLDFTHLTVAGHSFGGATALLVAGVDHRVKCCLGMDVWWQPMGSQKVEVKDFAPKVPVMLIQSEKFDSEDLRSARLIYLNGRMAAASKEDRAVTEMMTIKDTVHANFSDFPLVFKALSRKSSFSGSLSPSIAKDVNSRACLHFVQEQLFTPGLNFPQPVELVHGDKEHLKVEDFMKPKIAQ